MSICKFFETPGQYLKTTLVGSETKLNSSKSTLQSSKHPLINKSSHAKIIKFDV